MTHHQLLLAAITFTALCVLGSLSFFGWLGWHLFWDVWDHIAQERRRNKRRRSHEVGGVYWDGARR